MRFTLRHRARPMTTQAVRALQARRTLPAPCPQPAPCSGAAAARCSTAGAGPSSEGRASGLDLWDELRSLKRDMDAAVAREDFSRAALLRDQTKPLVASLPPVQQFLYGQLQRLDSGNAAEKLAAVRALGEAGDASVLPELAPLLHSDNADLVGAAHDALWAVFGRHPDPRVSELMGQGVAAMEASSMAGALEAFEEVVALDPKFAEAYNKRATVLYLLQRFSESIADCRRTLALNPWHFGAASGMGLCHCALGQREAAVGAFERALAIHPGLSQVRQQLAALKARLASDQAEGA